MARVFSDGAEFGDLLWWTYTDGEISVDGTTKRGGGYSYKLNIWSADGYKSISALSEFYFRQGFYCAGNSTSRHILTFRSDGATVLRLTTDALNHWTVLDGAGTTIEDSGVVATEGIWHLIEVHYKVATAPNGIFQVKVDGIQIINFSGDTTYIGYGTINNILWACNLGGVESFYIDDLALNDTTGGVDDSWCGDEHYELLNPNDNGDVNNWTGSDGDKVNNYALVDEVPPTGDTDYVTSNTPGQQDMYGLSAFDDTGKIVTRIWAEGRGRDTNSLSGQVKIGYKTGGSVYLSPAITLASVYQRIVGPEATVNPADSAAWEKADLDALQYAQECE